ncbi:MAG: polyprenyl synthetase family protein [Tepidisphaeraceae bacterium]
MPATDPLALQPQIAQRLAAVEAAFNDELHSDLPVINELVEHVARYRGKMLRPVLAILCGQAVGKLEDAHTVIATVVEMVHMATLVHDDVLDEADLRRRGVTVNRLRGNEAAVHARRLPHQPQLSPLQQPEQPVRGPGDFPHHQSGL